MGKDLMKKGVLIGVGLAAYAQEHAEKLAKELIKKHKVTKKEGKAMVMKIKREAEKHGKKVSRMAESEVKRILKAAEVKGAKRMGVKKKTVKRRKKKK
tara:strand:+ start:1839 stop:2132 length:294 start_codon:yes stop_codon:yes gene_type:complete